MLSVSVDALLFIALGKPGLGSELGIAGLKIQQGGGLEGEREKKKRFRAAETPGPSRIAITSTQTHSPTQATLSLLAGLLPLAERRGTGLQLLPLLTRERERKKD